MSVNVLPKFAVGDRVVILFGCNQGRRKIIRKIEKTPNNRIFYIFCGEKSARAATLTANNP